MAAVFLGCGLWITFPSFAVFFLRNAGGRAAATKMLRCTAGLFRGYGESHIAFLDPLFAFAVGDARTSTPAIVNGGEALEGYVRP